MVFLITVPLPLFHLLVFKSVTSLPRAWAIKSKQKHHVKTNKTTQLLGFVQESILYEHLSSQIITTFLRNSLENLKFKKTFIIP